MNTGDFGPSLASLFTELVFGTQGETYVLNRGDAGLLGSLERMTAQEASVSSAGGATVAAHVDHVRYGLSLMNRWQQGENPFKDADWTASWRIGAVSDEEWRELRNSLQHEAHAWRDGLQTPRDVNEMGMLGMIGSVAHLAYHLGAIRQISVSARGPKESGTA